MPDSVRPHRRQPTRLPCPWDSPDKKTGVGCHFLLQCMKVKSESEGAQSCLTPCDPIDSSPPGSSIHGIFQTRVLEWGAIASIPGLGRAPGGGNSNPLQYSCLGNPMDGGAWEATVPGVAKSRTRLSNFTTNLDRKSTRLNSSHQKI